MENSYIDCSNKQKSALKNNRFFRKFIQIGNYPSYLICKLPIRQGRKEVTAVSANERRAEIMRIMVARRQENMQVLAAEL